MRAQNGVDINLIRFPTSQKPKRKNSSSFAINIHAILRVYLEFFFLYSARPLKVTKAKFTILKFFPQPMKF